MLTIHLCIPISIFIHTADAVAVLVFSQHFCHGSKDGHYNMINMVIYPFIRIFFTIYVPVVRILNIGWMTVNNISSGCFASPVIFPTIS